MSVASHFTRTYTTFSGIDIKALFDDLQVMTLQGIAVSVTREKVPVYGLGRARPLSISRGKRGIAGTLQFVQFDREALYSLMQDPDHYYYAHNDDINWLSSMYNAAAYQAEIGDANKVDINGQQFAAVGSSRQPAEYMDQIYPFDVTLNAFNEYGNGSYSAIIGLEIINEGTGLSTDDLTNEVQTTYIAIHRLPWTPLDKAEGEQYWATNVFMNEDGNVGVQTSQDLNNWQEILAGDKGTNTVTGDPII